MKKNILELSIVISSYNTRDLLKKTLVSVYKKIKNINFEVILIDDASSDETSEMIKKYFPKIKNITNNTNLGYSKNYNMGTRKARGEYILHLNSDVEFLNAEPLREAIAFMKNHRNVGLIGCKILKADGRLELPCRRSFPTPMNVFFQSVGLSKIFPKNKFFGNYYLTYLDENKVTEVDCIMGAFMLIKREAIRKIGYLDENFFIYGEDIDFCYRTRKAGWKIIYFPELVIKHIHGGTTNKFRLKYIWHFHYAMFQYYNKHFARKRSLFFNLMVYIGIIVRFTGNALLDSLNLFKLTKVHNSKKIGKIIS